MKPQTALAILLIVFGILSTITIFSSDVALHRQTELEFFIASVGYIITRHFDEHSTNITITYKKENND